MNTTSASHLLLVNRVEVAGLGNEVLTDYDIQDKTLKVVTDQGPLMPAAVQLLDMTRVNAGRSPVGWAVPLAVQLMR